MLRLGLRLTLHSGRETLVRLLVTAAAVAVGVAHTARRARRVPRLPGQRQPAVLVLPQGRERAAIATARTASCGTTAWTFTKGRLFMRLDVAALGPGAPVTHAHAANRAGHLLGTPRHSRSLPADGGRRPAGRALPRQAGRPDRPGRAPTVRVTWPSTSGRTQAQVRASPARSGSPRSAARVAQAVVPPRSSVTRSASGVLAVLFPMLVLIGTATRPRCRPAARTLAALRRRRRWPRRYQGPRRRSSPCSARSSARPPGRSSSCWYGPPSAPPR